MLENSPIILYDPYMCLEENPLPKNELGQPTSENISPYGVHTTNLIHSFNESPEIIPLLTSAEAILRGIVTGNLSLEDAESAIIELESQDIFAILYSPYGDRPLLAAMREAVEKDLAVEDMQTNKKTAVKTQPDTKPHSTPRPATEMGPQTVPHLPKDEFAQSEFPRDFTFMRSHADMELLWDGTSGVHISRTSLCNITTIQAIISSCPNLQFIQVSPSLADNFTGPGIRKMLEDNAIELRVGRVKDCKYYDDMPKGPDFVERHALFSAFLGTEEGNKLFDLLMKYESIEAKIALMYFTERKSLRDIAKELGMTAKFIQKKMRIIGNILGFPTEDPRLSGSARFLIHRISRFEEAENKQKEKDALRESYGVDDEIPPMDLDIRRWPLWREIKKIERDHPERIEKLKKQEPFLYEIVVRIYDLAHSGTCMSNNQLAAENKVSHNLIYRRHNQAMELLGIADEL